MYILYNSTENADNTLASRNGRNKDGGCTHVVAFASPVAGIAGKGRHFIGADSVTPTNIVS